MIEMFNVNIVKVLTVFSLSPGSKLNRKTLKEKTMMNNVSLDKTLHNLLNFSILIKKRNFFSLNFGNKDTKKIINLVSKQYTKFKQLPLNAYFTILDIKTTLSKIKNIGDVYLFGSYAKLIFKQDSDIDIAIISDKIKKKEINQMIKKLEKRYKKNIEVHYFTKKFYKNKRDPLVKDILRNGIKLI